MEKSENELIAEFMGGRVAYVSYGKKDVWVFPFREDEGGCDTLLFDTSWDWLMPIVEKIEGLGYITSITTGSCVICAGAELEKREDISLFSWHSGVNYNTKLHNTYEAVVEFIRWYNSQQK